MIYFDIIIITISMTATITTNPSNLYDEQSQVMIKTYLNGCVGNGKDMQIQWRPFIARFIIANIL